MDDEFAVLLKRLREGEEKAWEELLRRYAPLLGDKQALPPGLSEAPAETRRLVLKNIGKFRHTTPGKFIAWVKRIRKHAEQALYRREHAPKRDRDRRVPIQDDVITDPGPSPSSKAAQNETEEKLRTVQDQLTPEEREILVWRQEGVTYAEIGERLGVSHVAAMNRFRRALMRLRELMGEQ